jgi:hypothetical protein
MYAYFFSFDQNQNCSKEITVQNTKMASTLKYLNLKEELHGGVKMQILLLTTATVPVPEARTCTICMEEVRSEGENLVILRCGHLFHRNCIFHWLRESRPCPSCREDLGE